MEEEDDFDCICPDDEQYGECSGENCECDHHVEPCMICGYRDCICDMLYERDKERRLGIE